MDKLFNDRLLAWGTLLAALAAVVPLLACAISDRAAPRGNDRGPRIGRGP